MISNASGGWCRCRANLNPSLLTTVLRTATESADVYIKKLRCPTYITAPSKGSSLPLCLSASLALIPIHPVHPVHPFQPDPSSPPSDSARSDKVKSAALTHPPSPPACHLRSMGVQGSVSPPQASHLIGQATQTLSLSAILRHQASRTRDAYPLERTPARPHGSI